jgi:hypothetical protein
MRASAILFSCALACVGLVAPITAQEGHPLVGTWHGDWGPSAAQRTRLVFYMKQDVKTITGTINPGPKGFPLAVANLDASKWMVHFEADGKDAAGNPVHIVADGKMDNIGSYNRTIAGTWTQGSVKGDFKLTRD